MHTRCVQIALMAVLDDEVVERPGAAIRLEEARVRRGFLTAKAAADFFGWNYSSYSQHERGERGFAKVVDRYARGFRVRKGWLLTGEGERDAVVPIVGRIGADPEGNILYAEGHETGDYAPFPPGGSAKAVAVEVAGHSMHGWADDGSLIYYEERHDPPTDDMLGHVVVVGLDTGEVLVKRLLRGSRKGRYDLESIAGPMRTDAKVEWAAHVAAIVPPPAARRIILRGG
jgi:SOS-response transcriptional repressor LexA